MTTMSNEAIPDRLDEQASLWATRIEGGLGDRDRAELAAWLAADERHRHALARYCALSVLLDARLGGVGRRTAGWRRFRPVIAAAALAAAAVVALVTAPGLRPREFSTTTGERRTVMLDDGSTIELNARTSLLVDYHRRERRLTLARGEAWFRVEKDPARPFVVATPAGSIRVTGTQFDVRTGRQGRVEVTVLEGCVRLHAPGGAPAGEPAAAGSQALLAGGGVSVHPLPGGAARDAVAWRNGQTVFENTPLSEAVERFAAYDDRPVSVDPAVADLRLGGRFSLSDLDGLLDSVERVLPVRVHRDQGGAVRIAPAGH